MSKYIDKYAAFKYMPPKNLGKNGTRLSNCAEQNAFSREAARECAVLLKNENKALPLKNSKVALFGMGTYDFLICGRGSGEVYTSYHKNFYDGIKENGKIDIYEPISDIYNAIYIPARENNQKEPNLYLEEPHVDKNDIILAAESCDTAIITISRVSGETEDRKPTKGDYYLSDEETYLIDTVGEHFKKVIVVLNIGAVLDCSYFANNDKVDAVLCIWQGGSEGGAAAADLLVGDAVPSGKTVDTFAYSYEDYPGAAEFNKDNFGLDYTEDIFVGYRYFETFEGKKERVCYPFGFGLSYTEFAIDNITANETDGVITVSADVKNIGDSIGREVVQIYYGAPQNVLGNPAKQLIAFAKTKVLAPNESQTLTLSFKVTDMASYDDLGKLQKSAFLLEKGDYDIFVGNSVRDNKKVFTYTVDKNTVTEQLTARCVPQKLQKRLLANGEYEMLPQNDTPMQYPEHKSIIGTAPEKQINFDKVPEEISLNDFMAQLTDDELIDMVIGKSGFGLCNTACFSGIDRLDIPKVPTTDGPAGVRLWPQTGIFTTCFPSATALACSWDLELIERVSLAAAMEAKENNFGVWLTPALNIHKDPMCGRNFEYFSEDPYVTGKVASAIVRGIQSIKVAASVKHFACNNKETERLNSDSRVSERALREVYLKGFRICVQESDPWTIMTAYNKLNGTYAPENNDLITGILRGEWGYKGVTTTDWGTLSNKVNDIKAGTDMIMPDADKDMDKINEAYRRGELTRADLEQCVYRMLTFYQKLV